MKAENQAEILLDYIRDHLEDYYGDDNKLYDKTHLINKISKTMEQYAEQESREMAIKFTNYLKSDEMTGDLTDEYSKVFDDWKSKQEQQ